MGRKKYKKHSGHKFKFVLFILIVFAIIQVPKVYSATFNNLKFAQISDAHFSTFEKNTSYKMLENSADLLADAINQVNLTHGVNFVMFTGDLINTPYQKELSAFIPYANKLCCPWYATFGNHDISIDGYLTKKVYFDILNSHNLNFSQTKPYYSFIPKRGYKVIALDTTIDTEITTKGRIDEEQLKWLDEELKSSKNCVPVIFMHVPIEPPYKSDSHILKNADEVKSILNKYDMPMIICSGHFHAVKVLQENNKLYVSSPSLVSYPNAFRIVNINSQKRKIIVDLYLKETRLEEIKTRAKLRILGGNLLYGEDSDRTATYELAR